MRTEFFWAVIQLVVVIPNHGLLLDLRLKLSGIDFENGWSLVEIFIHNVYEGWNFNSGNYLFTTDTK